MRGAAEIVREAEIVAETVDAADVPEAGDEGEGAVDVPEAVAGVDVMAGEAEDGTNCSPRILTDRYGYTKGTAGNCGPYYFYFYFCAITPPAALQLRGLTDRLVEGPARYQRFFLHWKSFRALGKKCLDRPRRLGWPAGQVATAFHVVIQKTSLI